MPKNEPDWTGYNECVEKMRAGARAWIAAHPFAQPEFRTSAFEAEVIAQARAQGQHVPEGKGLIAAPLDEYVITRWAKNIDAQELLRAMDKASGHQATYMQAKMIIEDAIMRALEKASGQLTSGDWRCPCCAELLDGYVAIDGRSGKPEAGTYTVCSYCIGIARVADSGDRYEGATLARARDEHGFALVQHIANAQAMLRKARDERAAEAKRRS